MVSWLLQAGQRGLTTRDVLIDGGSRGTSRKRIRVVVTKYMPDARARKDLNPSSALPYPKRHLEVLSTPNVHPKIVSEHNIGEELAIRSIIEIEEALTCPIRKNTSDPWRTSLLPWSVTVTGAQLRCGVVVPQTEDPAM